MHLTGLDLLLWVASFAANCSVLVVLLVRRRFKTFPLFTAFFAGSVFRSIVLFFVQYFGSKRTYFNTYWSLAAVDMLFQLGIVYELYSLVFGPVQSWPRNLRRSLIAVITMSTGAAVILTVFDRPHTTHWEQALMIRGNFFSAILMTELFVGMVVLSVTIGLPWTTHVAKIAQGFGVYCAVGVLIETIQSYFGLTRDMTLFATLSHFRIALYILCAAYWGVALWMEAPPPRELTERMQQQLAFVHSRLETELQGLRLRKTP